MNAAQLDLVRAVVEQCIDRRLGLRIGIITSFDPNRWAVKVKIMPEMSGDADTESGWMKLASPWVGNGWGLFMAPTPGDEVELHFDRGNPNLGYAMQRFFNDDNLPCPAPSQEMWLIHKSGSALKFTNDGKVSLSTMSDFNLSVGGDFNANITGQFNIQSTLVQANCDVVADTVSVQTHLTTGVQPGSGISGVPQA